jgi:osmoprotectant transport system ATP-binding protein
MIELSGVCKSYDGGVSFAVRDVDLQVAEGELVVLLGESGCGKTTTLKMINRLIEPTAGRITVDEADVREQVNSGRRGGTVPFRILACLPAGRLWHGRAG